MKKTRALFFYVIAISIIVFALYYPILHFTFWKDDWGYFFTIKNHIPYDVFYLHPGTFLEFFLLMPVFGNHILLWQSTGIFLKIGSLIAISYLSRVVTKNAYIGYIAGILSAFSYIGMDSVGWVSSHVTLINGMLLSFAFGFFIRYMETQEKRYRFWFFVFGGLFFLFDPGRNGVILPLCFVYIFLFYPKFLLSKKALVSGVIASILCISLGFLLLWRPVIVIGASTMDFILQNINTPFLILQKLYVLQRFVHTYGVLLVGWVNPLQEFDNTLSYSRPVMVTGFLFFIFYIYELTVWIKKRTQSSAIILFCLSFMFITHLPDWLFEPRLIPGGTHRYMVVPGIGFMLCMSYILYRWKYRTTAVFMGILFIVGNSLAIQNMLTRYEKERSDVMTAHILETMSSRISDSDHPIILLITGDHPIINPGMIFSMPASLAVTKNVTTIQKMPWYIHDFTGTNYDIVASLLCEKNPSWNIYKRIVSAESDIRLSQVYHFILHKDNSIENASEYTRKKIFQEAKDRGCQLIE